MGSGASGEAADGALDEFARGLAAWLDVLERAREVGLDVFVERSAADLAALYAAGLRLPEAPPVPDPPEFAAAVVREAPAEALAGVDAYHALFDPSGASADPPTDPAPEVRSLAGDLVALAEALAPGLAAWREGRGDLAAHDWRFELRGHAGTLLVSVLTGLHALVRFPPEVVDEA